MNEEVATVIKKVDVVSPVSQSVDVVGAVGVLLLLGSLIHILLTITIISLPHLSLTHSLITRSLNMTFETRECFDALAGHRNDEPINYQLFIRDDIRA